MDYNDILQLIALYAGYATTVFCLSYGAFALYGFFRDITVPSFKLD